LVLALRPLMPVVEALFVVLFFVASLIVRVLIAVLSHLPRREPQQIGQPTTVIDDLLRRLREFEVNRQFVESARWGMTLALLALLVLGMAITIVLIRRRERKQDEDERESVWSARDALSALTGLLSGLRIRRAPGPEAPPPEVSAIRRIYRALLEIGSAHGAPRKLWATPREYLPPLRGAPPRPRLSARGRPWSPRLRLLLRNAADELERRRASVLDLVPFIWRHPHHHARLEVLFAGCTNHHALTFEEIHLLLVPVVVQGRRRAGVDLEHAHGEVLGAALLVDDPPDLDSRHRFGFFSRHGLWAKDLHTIMIPNQTERDEEFPRHRANQ
jgi:hypothetical protein